MGAERGEDGHTEDCSEAAAGFEAYFIELAEAGDPLRRSELAAKYGVTYSSEWVADLISKHKLKLLGQ